MKNRSWDLRLTRSSFCKEPPGTIRGEKKRRITVDWWLSHIVAWKHKRITPINLGMDEPLNLNIGHDITCNLKRNQQPAIGA